MVFGRGAFEDDLAIDDVHEVVELGLAVVVTGALVDDAVDVQEVEVETFLDEVTGALVDEAVEVQEVEVETFLDEDEVMGALVLDAGGAR